MANWKKVLVSGSNIEVATISGSSLNLSGIAAGADQFLTTTPQGTLKLATVSQGDNAFDIMTVGSGSIAGEIDNFSTTSFTDINGEIKQMLDYNKISFIEEQDFRVSSSQPEYIRSFTFVDNEKKTKFDDKYVYSLFISFYDPSISALQNIVSEINNSIQQLSRYINLAASPKYYNPKTKELNLPPVDFFPWIQSVATYVKYYSLMNNLSRSKKEELAVRYYNFLNPQGFDLKSSKSFLYKFKEFATSFLRHFKISSNMMMQNLVSGNSQEVYQNVDFSI